MFHSSGPTHNYCHPHQCGRGLYDEPLLNGFSLVSRRPNHETSALTDTAHHPRSGIRSESHGVTIVDHVVGDCVGR